MSEVPLHSACTDKPAAKPQTLQLLILNCGLGFRVAALRAFRGTPYNSTLYPTLYILHPTPYTLHPTLYTQHPTPAANNSNPHILNPKLSTLQPNPPSGGQHAIPAVQGYLAHKKTPPLRTLQ
jgi:hypothetical protein